MSRTTGFTFIGHDVLLFPITPIAIDLMVIPDSTIFLPFLHTALMDWAPGGIVRFTVSCGVFGCCLLGFAIATFALIAPTAVDIWHAVIAKQVGDSAIDLLQQL